MLRARIITGIVLALVTIGVVWFAPPIAFTGLVLVISVIAAREFSDMIFGRGARERELVSTVVLVVASLHVWQPNVSWQAVWLTMSFLVALYFMWRLPSFERFTSSAGSILFAAVYLGLAWPTMILIHRLEHGPALILMLVAGTAFSDTGAFIAGKRWGKRKCTPLISPNKTVVGLWGGLVGALCFTFILRAIVWPSSDALAVFGMAVLIAIVAPLGDLIESVIKRGAHVKDSGSLLPGHGGILDRIDAYIVVAPCVYYYAQWVGL